MMEINFRNTISYRIFNLCSVIENWSDNYIININSLMHIDTNRSKSRLVISSECRALNRYLNVRTCTLTWVKLALWGQNSIGNAFDVEIMCPRVTCAFRLSRLRLVLLNPFTVNKSTISKHRILTLCSCLCVYMCFRSSNHGVGA